MGTMLTCGPFARTGKNNEDGCLIIFPINTQGDWINTEEGHEALENAQRSIATACEEGKLPKDTEFEWRNDDQAIVKIPYDSWDAALKSGAAIKELIPAITGAVVTDLARKIG